MFMVFGLELSTFAILRWIPGLMPKSIRNEVIPAASDLKIVDVKAQAKAQLEAVEAHQQSRLEKVAEISRLTKDMATAMADSSDSTHASEAMDQIVSFIERIESPEERIGVPEIVAVASLFRKHMTMDKLPREQLLNLARLHETSSVASGIPLPGSLGVGLNKYTPSLLLARSLRKHVQKLRSDDKE